MIFEPGRTYSEQVEAWGKCLSAAGSLKEAYRMLVELAEKVDAAAGTAQAVELAGRAEDPGTAKAPGDKDGVNDPVIALAIENALIFIDEAKAAGNVHAPGIVKLLLKAQKLLASAPSSIGTHRGRELAGVLQNAIDDTRVGAADPASVASVLVSVDLIDKVQKYLCASAPSAIGAFYCDFKGPRCQEQCPVCAGNEQDYKDNLRRPEHGPSARADDTGAKDG